VGLQSLGSYGLCQKGGDQKNPAITTDLAYQIRKRLADFAPEDTLKGFFIVQGKNLYFKI
jgi:hypothetical protein